MGFINVQKDKQEAIINGLIDREDYIGLSKDRTRLVPLGVALGLSNPQELRTKNSLMREEQVKNNNELYTVLTCAKVYLLNQDKDLNDELCTDEILQNADRCLNYGLDVLEEQINSIPSQNRDLRLVEYLDELYSKNVK